MKFIVKVIANNDQIINQVEVISSYAAKKIRNKLENKYNESYRIIIEREDVQNELV